MKKKLPTKVKRRRKIKRNNAESTQFEEAAQQNNEADSEGWEEYYDYIFPDDEDQKKSIKILEHALGWHQTKVDTAEPTK